MTARTVRGVTGWIFIIVAGLLAVVAGTQAAGPYEEMSQEDRLYVRGLISEVEPAAMQITVRPLKGSQVIITVEPDTELHGFSNLGDLQKKQQVKVWYTVEGEKNRALRVEKMMDLGC